MKTSSTRTWYHECRIMTFEVQLVDESDFPEIARIDEAAFRGRSLVLLYSLPG